MNYSKFNDEVIYAIDPIVKLSKEEIKLLKTFADESYRNRSRLCAHKEITDPLHEMVIIHKNNAYVRPHKHIGKSESFHLIEGEVILVLFEDDGELREVVHMGDYNSGKVFYYRIEEPIFHSIIIQTDYIVFHESTEGPFQRDKTIFADWSPEEADLNEVYLFEVDLNLKIKELNL